MRCFCLTSSRKEVSSLPRGIHEGIHPVHLYSYKEMRIATNNFSVVNKIGAGGFGDVYKGMLKDGTMVAVKVLSPESRQGMKEFLTELVVIADIQHENLVELYGCCVEEENRILVYGYLENKSLAQTLLSGSNNSIDFTWATRKNIAIGVARGLAFLHEQVRPHVIHRDIKASNVLLDRDLNAKISDFGLAKLIPPNATHVSTKVAGTLGYLAPEYAIHGKLTRKADIYSFGVLLLEIVSGRCNRNKQLHDRDQYLIDKAYRMYAAGELANLVDGSLRGDLDIEEGCKFLKIALLCTQDVPKLRPSISTVVKLLEGDKEFDESSITKHVLLDELSNMGVQEKRVSKWDTDSSSSLFSPSFPSQDDSGLSRSMIPSCDTITE